MLAFGKRSRRYGVEIPLTSLIDIVFLLLIYFLLTTNFLTEEGVRVNLPQARALHESVDSEIIVHLQIDGNIYLNNQIVSSALFFQQLQEMAGQGIAPVVIVKADKDIIVDRVVALMDLARSAGVEKILLATERKF